MSHVFCCPFFCFWSGAHRTTMASCAPLVKPSQRNTLILTWLTWLMEWIRKLELRCLVAEDTSSRGHWSSWNRLLFRYVEGVFASCMIPHSCDDLSASEAVVCHHWYFSWVVLPGITPFVDVCLCLVLEKVMLQ